jgi:lactate dehydrogenase-like 2-hydroxyacid dehydrogenase
VSNPAVASEHRNAPGARRAVLMLKPISSELTAGLEERFELIRAWENTSTQSAEGGNDWSQIRALVTTGSHGRVDARFLDKLPRLEIIANWGAGYDQIDVTHAARRGLIITNTPDVMTEDVADLAVGLLLAAIRKLTQADRFVRDRQWPSCEFVLTSSLQGRKVGIVGLGRIGKAIARRLNAFNVDISYHGRRPQLGIPYQFHESLVDMAESSDVLVVSASGGADTQSLIEKRTLAALGASGVLINVARGSVVDEYHLLEALKSKTILAAGLDVFKNEPRISEEFFSLENVVLSPHVGSATARSRQMMNQLVLDNLDAWFKSRQVVTPVGEMG